MALTLSRIDRLERAHTITSPLTGVTLASVALLSPRSKPTLATTWTAATYAGGVVTVLLAGPDADPTGALAVPTTADLWVKVTNGTEVDAELVERVSVEGGGAPLPQPLNPAVQSVNGKTGTAITLAADDVGAQPAGDYATTADLATGLGDKQDAAALDTTVAALLADTGSATYAAVVALIEARSGFGR